MAAVDRHRIVVIDDSDIVREALTVMLGTYPDLDVVGAAEDGRQGVHVVLREAPDVVLMDLRMPVLDGIAASREIRAALPATRIIMLSAYDDPSLEQAALAEGVEQYIVKGSSPTIIAAAIRGPFVTRPDEGA